MKVKLLALTGWALSFGLSSALSANAQRQPKVVSEVSASEPVTFELYIPLANKAALEQLLADQQTTTSPQYHQWLTPAQVQERFGPSAKTVAAVSQELDRYGLTVKQISPQLLQVTRKSFAVMTPLGAPLTGGTTPFR